MTLSNRACHPVLGEIRDHAGNWHTGWLPIGHLADLIGTSTRDLIRRLVLLGVMEHREGRHRLTALAKRKPYGTTVRRRAKGGLPRLETDVILPDGMVLLVQNLEATNLPLTETERLHLEGLSQRAIGARLGITQRAVRKRLADTPPRLKDWPVLGSWNDGEEGGSEYPSAVPPSKAKVAQALVA